MQFSLFQREPQSQVAGAVPVDPVSVPPMETDLGHRTPRQWYQSIKTYLEWRAGCCWRPLSDRFHPVRLEYLRAIDVLRQAYDHDERATLPAQLAPAPKTCPGWSPSRRLAFERKQKRQLPPRKPAASVTARAAKERNA